MTDWSQLSQVEQTELHFAVLTSSDQPDSYCTMLEAGLASAGVSAKGHGITVTSDFEACVRHLASIGFRGALALDSTRVEAARMGEKFFLANHSMGVANALSFQAGRVLAQNTEVPSIASLISEVEPGKALVLGSGAAARSTIMALFELGWQVRLWNRSALKARPMIPLFARFGKIELIYQPDPAECRLVVNCTPLGAKAGQSPPLEWGHVRPKTVFMDLVVRRVPTDFLRTATSRGLAAIDGRNVIVESGAKALEWWTGKTIDRGAMRVAQGLH